MEVGKWKALAMGLKQKLLLLGQWDGKTLEERLWQQEQRARMWKGQLWGTGGRTG